jgi:sugar O-acyltransferase (sialic acid O-acetyltransferase NeuD family)
MKKGIIGSGGFGREVKHMLLDNNPNEIIDFFVDDNFLDNISIPLSKLDINEYEIVIAIGDPKVREKIVNRLPKNTKYFKAIHKSVQILDKDIVIGDGSIICPNTILTTNITIGSHCHLNLFTTVGHDTKIGDFFTTAPGTKISGNCVIGDRVYFGTNASVREKIVICDDVTIGLNSGVVKDINESGIYGGVPAKKIK